MHFRSILSGTLAVMLLSGGSALASDGAFSGRTTLFSASNAEVPLPKVGLPGVLGENNDRPVRMAQAGDPRISTLEEQVRQLSGTIEELNFQILQMQEQLRKQQEDNEFRFQELEKKKSDAGGDPSKEVAQNAPAVTVAPQPDKPADSAAPAGDVAVAAPDVVAQQPSAPGAPEKTFGTITFDSKGNVTGGSTELPAAAGNGSDNTTVAALPATDDPEELYRNSYEFILSGDYGTAETGFRDHISRFPADAKAADAHFWLGEALLGQKKYRDAAEIFLAANRDYPTSKKAPDMLLKLGVSLVGLKQHDVACATFTEIGKKYPQTSGALKERVKQEQALAAC